MYKIRNIHKALHPGMSVAGIHLYGLILCDGHINNKVGPLAFVICISF